MHGIIHYWAFLAAGILLNLTPGNDTMYTLSQSIARGRQAGIYSALGIGTGTIIHTLLAAFGLSLIIAQSVVLFTIIKYAGAAYLIYLGATMLKDKTIVTFTGEQIQPESGHAKTYRDAIITNVFNPKVALFFMAFLPQFIDPSSRGNIVPFLALGFTFVITGTVWCLILATFASGLAARLKSHRTFPAILNRTAGTILIGLGAKLAFTRLK
ncbi:MAG TPA: LysE family translocator [Bacteroidota bacterium]